MVDRSSSQELPSTPNEPDPNFIRWLRENCVPIAAVIFGGLVLCLFGHYSSNTIDWSRTKDFTDAFRNVVQALAFIAGGVWAYFRFVKERTFEERLTPAVTGRLALIDDVGFLIITVQMKNVGLSRITLDTQSSSLIVFECILAQPENVITVVDNPLTSVAVFGEKKRSIEPNEAIEDQLLIVIHDPAKIAYRLELAIVSNSGYGWSARTIVDRTALTHNSREEVARD